jgi:hypothetical protein
VDRSLVNQADTLIPLFMKLTSKKWFLVVGIVAIGCMGLVALRHSVLGRIQDARRLDSLIDALYARQPANLDTTQWKCMVDWTKNLHGNSLIAYQTSASEIIALESRIEKQFAGHVDADTIEWLWDEYAKACPGGREYQRFRQSLNESLVALKSPVLIPLYPMDQKQSY